MCACLNLEIAYYSLWHCWQSRGCCCCCRINASIRWNAKCSRESTELVKRNWSHTHTERKETVPMPTICVAIHLEQNVCYDDDEICSFFCFFLFYEPTNKMHRTRAEPKPNKKKEKKLKIIHQSRMHHMSHEEEIVVRDF